MQKDVVVLDADMFLLDFNLRVEQIYCELFNRKPPILDKKAFKAAKVYDFSSLSAEDLEVFVKATNGKELWGKMPALNGAVDFVRELEKNFGIIILTTMSPEFLKEREKNFNDLGIFPKEIHAVQSSKDYNPKEKTLRELKKKYNVIFFMDDLAKNFKDLNDLDIKHVWLDKGYSDENKKIEGIKIDYIENSYEGILSNVVNKYLKNKKGNKNGIC